MIEKCEIISGIFAIKRISNTSSLKFANAKFGLKYRQNNFDWVLFFDGINPGKSFANIAYNSINLKDFEVVGKPIPYSEFRYFFKRYCVEFGKRFYYINLENKEIDYESF